MSSLLSAGIYEDDSSSFLGLKLLPSSSLATNPQFHLVLLLDTSGSMEGERIAAVKRTLHLLVDKLADNNTLTLIDYNSGATILANSTIVTSTTRETLKVQIDALHATGGTNLEAALTSLRDVKNVDAVFLLTDGHVNQGITSRNGLLRIFNAAVPYGTPVNTLGYGADHDSSSLKYMAIHTCGSYTFADAAELIPAIIGDIVGGLTTTVGRCANLEIPEGWTSCELAPTQGKTYSIGTLIANKPQYVLLKAPKGTALPAELTVSYKMGTTLIATTITSFSSIPKVDVAVQKDRCAVATAFATATDHLEFFQYEDARRCLQEVGVVLDASIAKDTPMGIQLRAQVDDMLEALAPANSHAQWNGVPGGQPPMGIHREYAMHTLSSLAPPPLAPVISRMASNMAALGLQRGFLTTTTPAGGRTPSAVHHTFSSDEQHTQSIDMTTRYTENLENA